MSWLSRLIARFRKPVELPQIPLTTGPYTVVYTSSPASVHAARRPDIFERPGIKPPPDEHWSWSTWANEMRLYRRVGWAYGRFATRHEDDKASLVFGITSDPFGIYPLTGTIHYWLDGAHHTEEQVLAVLTHLESGTGVGLFITMEDAASAAELAARVSDWHLIEPERPSSWGETVTRTRQAWRAAGIQPIQNGHAVIQGNRRELYQPQSPTFGRPELLS